MSFDLFSHVCKFLSEILTDCHFSKPNQPPSSISFKLLKLSALSFFSELTIHNDQLVHPYVPELILASVHMYLVSSGFVLSSLSK
jgi:hypothetical protein